MNYYKTIGAVFIASVACLFWYVLGYKFGIILVLSLCTAGRLSYCAGRHDAILLKKDLGDPVFVSHLQCALAEELIDALQAQVSIRPTRRQNNIAFEQMLQRSVDRYNRNFA